LRVAITAAPLYFSVYEKATLASACY